MWYFGSVVCERGWYRFEKTFQDFTTAKKVWEEYYKKMQGVCRKESPHA